MGAREYFRRLPNILISKGESCARGFCTPLVATDALWTHPLIAALAPEAHKKIIRGRFESLAALAIHRGISPNAGAHSLRVRLQRCSQLSRLRPLIC
jgi:hypothetical protein